ncbi:Glutathione gamma-glutamylcysteinyltransferase 3 [Camellia lanceoleosa]|uniref:Glutathione gamma-glutamylcysteinyltransferase 3 n=1 Tax=Camellia lanceoleosa TaxID=1840588 RepID=A0ACC0F4W3_9ERIC|nr:Glutathione gamma-glutamylcysteinyltransferase 3 [Camellia lanceoleosa]
MGFMVLTWLPYDPCVLYTLSCRDGIWIRTANHLSQIPLLLESEDVKDVNQILSVLFMSVCTNFSVFIKQVAEAQGKDGHDQLLMQLRETELHKRISKWMDSMNSNSGFVTSFGNQHALLEIAANVASYGVKHSTLNPGSSGRLYPTDSAGSSKGNYESVSVEMSEPVTCSREQGPGKMIQTIDPRTKPICSLVSIESVPHILKKELVPLDSVDSSLAVGFYCRDKDDFDDFCNRASKLADESKGVPFAKGSQSL